MADWVGQSGDDPSGAISSSDPKVVQLGGRAVLVVEDEPVVMQSIVSMLELMGAAVVTADSGHGALEILRQRSVDVVLSDYSLPDMAGDILLRRLREIRNHTPIVVSSGLLVQPCDESVGLLPKPFSFDQLAAAIVNALDDVAE